MHVNRKGNDAGAARYSLSGNDRQAERRWTVVFFHPVDCTRVTGAEASVFAMQVERLRKLGMEVVVLSIDTIEDTCRGARLSESRPDATIAFAVEADPLGDVAYRLGAISADQHRAIAAGKRIMITRDVLIVDNARHVRFSACYPEGAGRSIGGILHLLALLRPGSDDLSGWMPGPPFIAHAFADDADSRPGTPRLSGHPIRLPHGPQDLAR